MTFSNKIKRAKLNSYTDNIYLQEYQKTGNSSVFDDFDDLLVDVLG